MHGGSPPSLMHRFFPRRQLLHALAPRRGSEPPTPLSSPLGDSPSELGIAGERDAQVLASARRRCGAGRTARVSCGARVRWAATGPVEGLESARGRWAALAELVSPVGRGGRGEGAERGKAVCESLLQTRLTAARERRRPAERVFTAQRPRRIANECQRAREHTRRALTFTLRPLLVKRVIAGKEEVSGAGRGFARWRLLVGAPGQRRNHRRRVQMTFERNQRPRRVACEVVRVTRTASGQRRRAQ